MKEKQKFYHFVFVIFTNLFKDVGFFRSCSFIKLSNLYINACLLFIQLVGVKQKIVFISKPKLERNEDEAVKLYKKVSNNPKRYIEIPTLKHEKHHEIFDKYKSNLPVEQELEDKILNCCNPLSIGGFKKDLKENFSLEIYKKVWYGWQNFKNKELSKIAKKWFKEQGYIVNWK